MTDILAILILDLVHDVSILPTVSTQLQQLQDASSNLFDALLRFEQHIPELTSFNVPLAMQQSAQQLNLVTSQLQEKVTRLKQTSHDILRRSSMTTHVENCLTSENFTETTPHHDSCPKSSSQAIKKEYYSMVSRLLSRKPFPSTQTIMSALLHVTSEVDSDSVPSPPSNKKRKIDSEHSLSSPTLTDTDADSPLDQGNEDGIECLTIGGLSSTNGNTDHGGDAAQNSPSNDAAEIPPQPSR